MRKINAEKLFNAYSIFSWIALLWEINSGLYIAAATAAVFTLMDMIGLWSELDLKEAGLRRSERPRLGQTFWSFLGCYSLHSCRTQDDPTEPYSSEIVLE